METGDSQECVGKGDLLLKAIQRTPSVKQSQCIGAASQATASSSCTIINNNNNIHSCNTNNLNNTNNDEHIHKPSPAASTACAAAAVASDRSHCDSLNNKDKNELDVDVSDCRSCCKRQKTVHNYDNNEHQQQSPPQYTATYINSIQASSGSSSNSHSYNSNNLPSRSSHLRDHTFSVIPNVTSYDDASAHLLAVKREHGDCSSGSYRRTMSESVVGTCHADLENCTQPGIDLMNRCDAMINILSDNELKLYRRAYSEDELISCNCDDSRPTKLVLNTMNNSPPTIGSNDFSTPTCKSNRNSSANDSDVMKATVAAIIDSDTTIDHTDLFKTPRSKHLALDSCGSGSGSGSNNNNQTKPIFIDCRSHRTDDDDCTQESMPSLNPSKSLPKINLTKLFTKTSDDSDCHELDINAELRKISHQATGIPPMFSFDFENLSPPLISPTGSGLVQKSNSAPSFQYSPPTLSPRFLKSAAAIKRRSRHLSDRSSERLSIGSDDHLSDEEFHQYCHDSEYRPGISPTKATLRFFPKNYAYRKRALLGKFE